jgi:hypothetical protein
MAEPHFERASSRRNDINHSLPVSDDNLGAAVLWALSLIAFMAVIAFT